MNTAVQPPAAEETDKPPLSENETEPQDADNGQQDFMMTDHFSYTAPHPRAPFPSPAIKSTLPFYPCPPIQQVSPMSQMNVEAGTGWLEQDTKAWQQGGQSGKCILVEAANRAQMSILVDDMGSMGIEQMEQS